MIHYEVVDMKDFDEWWNGDYDDRTSPFKSKDTPIYWAWAGWEAALRLQAMNEVQRLGQEIQPDEEQDK